MLILKKLTWDNCFSYGDNNYMEFNKEPLTQLMGINGAGKTSISLILQEVLYGKNNKNIKKQDIANNRSGKKGYYANLIFSKDNVEYQIELDRRSSLKLKLFQDGVDISSHTSLNTYKTIADITGISDFKVFCQLIYQHSTDSLDFLTATDTNRKKFLISLLQLDRYLELHEHFKDKVRIVNSDIASLQGSVSTIESWINHNKDMDFVKRDLEPVPDAPVEFIERAAELKKNIENINSINRKIELNKEYKKELNCIDMEYVMYPAPSTPSISSNELRTQVRILENEYRSIQQKINDIISVSGECPTCLQEVDETEQARLELAEIVKRDKLKGKIAALWDKIPETEEIETEIKKHDSEKKLFEKLNRLIDSELSTHTLDLDQMKTESAIINKQITDIQFEIKKANENNNQISAHNSKIDVVRDQLQKMKEDLEEKNITLTEKEINRDILELLKNTFGTNGLVSYKIESSVKELENKINEYLAELIHFRLYFTLVGDKLNIQLEDDSGNISSISNLSSGERARINVATVLAIRSILSILTSTRVNILFLDEIINSIDSHGREKLVEILLKENLNTFIVSHEWDHPLVPKLNIVKEHGISRIEHD